MNFEVVKKKLHDTAQSQWARRARSDLTNWDGFILSPVLPVGWPSSGSVRRTPFQWLLSCEPRDMCAMSRVSHLICFATLHTRHARLTPTSTSQVYLAHAYAHRNRLRLPCSQFRVFIFPTKFEPQQSSIVVGTPFCQIDIEGEGKLLIEGLTPKDIASMARTAGHEWACLLCACGLLVADASHRSRATRSSRLATPLRQR